MEELMKGMSLNAAKIELMVFVIDEFAKLHGLKYKQAYSYLDFHGGLAFLEMHYDVEHTLSFNEILSDVSQVCINRGGMIQ